MTPRIIKVAIIAALLGMITAGPILDQIPLPLLQWVQAVANNPDLLRVINGSATTYDNQPILRVYPVPGRTDRVLVVFPATIVGDEVEAGEWISVDQSRWDLIQ